MDGTSGLELLASGLAGATFLWLGLLVWVEGERRAGVTWALITTTLALSLVQYAALVRQLAPSWSAICGGLASVALAVMSVAWYATAIYHTRTAASRRRWRWLWRGCILLGLWAFAQTVLGAARPDLFPSVLSPRSNRVDTLTGLLLSLVSVGQVPLTLAAALVVYLRARRIYERTRELGAQRGIGLVTWFIVAALGLLVANVSAMLASWTDSNVTARSGGWAPIHWLAAIAALGSAAALIHAIRTNRALLGRPIQTRNLFLRWALLGILLLAPGVILWLSLHARPLEVVAVTLGAPILLAVVEWGFHRIYQNGIARLGRSVRDSVGGWPTFDPDVCRAQAERIFRTLVVELHPRACYLFLRTDTREEPFILTHRWAEPPPRPRPRSRYDVRWVEVGGQRLGFIALRGPGGIAYSALELELAQSYAYSIASLYVHSRQAQALEALVVRRERERHEHTQRLQRVLHDLVGGNLDAILKALQLYGPASDELAREVREAALESIVLIRSLLRGELADLFPTMLFREGLVAALRADVLPRYQSRHQQTELSIDVDGVDDIELNIWLTDELKRTIFGALDEAIRNALEYAGGTPQRPVWVHVRVSCDDSGLLIDVQDNGIGFVPELAVSEGDSLGLRYHQAALRLAGGAMMVESHPGRGTRVRLYLPSPVLRSVKPIHLPPPAPVQIARSDLEWKHLILEVEQQPGAHLLINDHLANLTHTTTALAQNYRCRGYGEDEVRQLVTIDERRQRIFRRHLGRFVFKEIVDREQLMRYIATGAIDERCQHLDLRLAHQHVRTVLSLLSTCDTYQLALSDQVFEANFAIKQGYAVLWEKRGDPSASRSNGVYKRIRDTDPDALNSFTRIFESAWDAVPVPFRERQQVIAWLEAQLTAAGG